MSSPSEKKEPSPDRAETLAFQPLIDFLASADSVADRLGYTNPALRAAYYKHVTMLLALGYVEVMATSVECPDWVPHLTFYFPWGSPNPDDVYRFVPMDARGTYRLSGIKGTAPVSLITMRKGGAHLGAINGKTLGEIDLNSVEADSAGHYSFILSAERPANHSGTWYALHPETESLLYRSRTKDATQSDAVCGIQRLDVSPGEVTPTKEDFARKLELLTTFASRQNEFLLGYLNALRARGGDKGFVADDQSGYGGVVSQRVLMHEFTLAPDEALILESEMPETVRYWSVQVYNAYFSAIDYVFHQSSLNDQQARIDSDGKLRIVVAAKDPGVNNWLDTGGAPQAGMLWRWTYASSFPVPSVTKVKLSEISGLLPADTPRLTAAQRKSALSQRAAYYQTRSR